MNPMLAATLVLAVSACGAQEGPDSPPLVLSSDPALAERAGEVLPDLVARSGLPLAEPVRVETRTRDELESYLAVKLEEELADDEAEWLRDAYALLGLVPPDLDLRRLLLSVYGEQVAGFYDPDSTALFVLADQDGAELETVLVHELVHAVQDQATDLASITAKSRGNDRQLAAQAAIEGHATLVMFEHLMQVQGMNVDLGRVPDFSGTIRPALEAMRSQFPALAAAPRVFQESLLFPYLEGATFVQTLWSGSDGRTAPFGDLLPESTEQILDPARFLSEPPDRPTDVTLEFSRDVTVLYENGLGAFETGIFLGTVAGPAAEAARAGWDGDRYALVEVEGERGLAWYSVWDDDAARDRFVRLVAGALGALPGPADVTSVDLGGRPGATVLVGPAPVPLVTLTGGLP